MEISEQASKSAQLGFSSFVDHRWNALDSQILDSFFPNEHSSEITPSLNNFKSVDGKLVWISAISGRYVGLLTRNNHVFATFANSTNVQHQVHAVSNGSITHVSIFQVVSKYYILIGDERGGVFVYSCETVENSFETTLLATLGETKHAVKSIVHQPIDMLHRSNQNILYLWLVCDDGVRFVGCKLPHNSSTTHKHSSPNNANSNKKAVKKIQQYFQLNVAKEEVLGVFQRVQMVDTAYGAGSCLAFHHFKKASRATECSMTLIFTVDCRAVLKFAEKIRRGESPPPDAPLPIGPIFAVPFISAQHQTPRSSAASKPFFGGHQSSTGAEETYAASVLVPDRVTTSPVVDYSSLDVALSRCVFGYTVTVLGSKGTVISATMESSQNNLRAALLESRGLLFSKPDTVFDLRVSAQYALLDADLNRVQAKFNAPVAQVLNLDAAEQEQLRSVKLWRACLTLDLLAPDRLALISAQIATHEEKFRASNGDRTEEMQQEKIVGRLVLMEAALATDSASALAEYILHRSSASNGYETQFALTDVKRVHEWAVRTAVQVGRLPSVQGHVEAMGRDLTLNYIAPLLLSRETRHPSAASLHVTATTVSSEVSRDFPIAINIELQAHVRECRGLKKVVEALLDRKLQSYDDRHATAGGVSSSDIIFGVLEEATTELRIRLHEVTCVLQTLNILHTVCAQGDLSFNCLIAGSSVTASGVNKMTESLFNANRARRLVIPSRLRYVPSDLHGGLLFDELTALLDEESRISTDVPNTDNLSDLVQFISDLFFLPLRALKASTAKLLHDMSSGAAVDNVDVSLTSAEQIAHSTLIHFLLSAYVLSCNPDELAGLDLDPLGYGLGTDAELNPSLVSGVLALAKVDAGHQVSGAVDDVLERRANIMGDGDMLLALIKRLICSDQLVDLKRLTLHLATAKNPLMSTKIGVLCHSVCLIDPDSWQQTWTESRKLCAHNLVEATESTASKQAVTRATLHWSMSNGELPRFLESYLDSVELDAVLQFLGELAHKEIERCAAQAPCVDLLVSYLLKQNLYHEALEVHVAHEAAVRTQPVAALSAASSFLATRAALLSAHAALPQAIGVNLRDVRGVVRRELVEQFQALPPRTKSPAKSPSKSKNQGVRDSEEESRSIHSGVQQLWSSPVKGSQHTKLQTVKYDSMAAVGHDRVSTLSVADAKRPYVPNKLFAF